MAVSEPRQFIDQFARVMELRSEINGSDYEIRIRLPQSYNAGDTHYPLLIVLDAEYTFYLASEIAALGPMWSQAPTGAHKVKVPEVIVVSVALPNDPPNPLRRNFEYMPQVDDEDFPPAVSKYMQSLHEIIGCSPEFGGAETFLGVLREEILPAVTARYRVDTSRRVLFGQSASGCFAAFTLFSDPSLFTDYIIVSPGLPGPIFRMEDAWAKDHDDLPARVLLSVGEMEIFDPLNLISSVAKLSEALNSRHYSSMQLSTWFIPGANHMQTAAPSISRGLMELGRP